MPLEAYAIFAEQGSPATHMTAAKAMDVIPRLPDCANQTGDAVFADTQIFVEDVFQVAEIRMSDVWARLP